jgi:malate dehydrogenase (oxaloacetate-decarboxylating)(NADP+)
MERSEKIRAAVSILDRREDVDFEYEGEMNVDVALDDELRTLYPFSRLTDAANVLVMPALHSASIATSLLATAGGATVIGPALTGLSKPIQIAPLGGAVSDIVNFATIAAFQAVALKEASSR